MKKAFVKISEISENRLNFTKLYLDLTTPAAAYTDDGFSITVAEPWFKQKVQILGQYLSSFASQLEGKADQIIFVDLTAGNGLYSLGAGREVFPGVPLMALQLDLPVSKFVFCENDPEQFKALKIRVNRYFKTKNVVLLDGSWSELVDRMSLYVPQAAENYRPAVLCVCNPFSLDVPFDVLDRLAEKGFNFLIPFTFALNDRVDYKHYLQQRKEKLKDYMGGYKDVEKLEKNISGNTDFYRRLVRVYEKNMEALGFDASFSVHKLDSGLMEMPTYTIGLFTRITSSKTIRQRVAEAGSFQTSLF